MRYMVERNFVQVVGYIWWPNNVHCAQEYSLREYDVENIRNEEGEITRDDVEQWLGTHAGDFSHIIDFRASIGDLEIPWSSEDNEMTYNDCMYPDEE